MYPLLLFISKVSFVLGPFCRSFTVMVHREWVFCVDEKGRQEEKQAADRIRTRKKKKMQKLKKQEEKRKAKENEEMKDDGRKDIEGNCQWAAGIKRVRLILPPPPIR
jgi:hypothetical protein